MKGIAPTTFRILSLAALTLLTPKVIAAPIRWEFSGQFDFISGNGNSLAGLLPGSTFTGCALGDTSMFSFVTSYQTYDGWISIYRDPLAILTYTATTTNGLAYTYSSRDLDVLIHTRAADNSYRLEIDAGFFFVGKDVYGSQPNDLSFGSFVSGMATGLSDGPGLIVIADQTWANSVIGSLWSLNQVIPEPSVGTLACMGGVLLRLFGGETWGEQQQRPEPAPNPAFSESCGCPQMFRRQFGFL